MPRRRALTLKRETLQELSPADLTGVAGAKPGDTWYSCLAYVSCDILRCVANDTTLCVE